MKTLWRSLCCISVVLICASYSSLTAIKTIADPLTGAWLLSSGEEQQVLQFVDGYHTQTRYSKPAKKFMETRGGPYTINGNKLNILVEFDTKDKDQTGQTISKDFSLKNDELTITANGRALTFKRIDNGTAPLAGLWSITGRMQDGKMTPIHRTGTRKTIKILSGTRFQWAAIDPGTKQFSGTGGGTYEFVNGKYTEHIEFFSRDSSRVGASLSFDGKLENGEWHHSGLSSKGDKIYEVWGRK